MACRLGPMAATSEIEVGAVWGRMLSSWVPHPRPTGAGWAPTDAMHDLRAQLGQRTRAVPSRLWQMARVGGQSRSVAFNAQDGHCSGGVPTSAPLPPSPPSTAYLARTKPSRACAARTMAAIDGMHARDAALLQILKAPSADDGGAARVTAQDALTLSWWLVL